MNRLEGKTALVTGASRGLGRVIAEHLAHEGAYVFAGYRARREDALQTGAALGSRGEVLQFDITDPGQVQAAFARIEASGRGLDVLINNAGQTRDGPFALMDLAEWKAVVDVNLTGAFHCIQAALPMMLRARRGAVVNVASVAGLRASPGQSNYAASKGGLLALTTTLAAELAPKGIRVNAVIPGLIDAGLVQHLDRRQVAQRVEMTPLRRLGRPHEVAQAVAFLASDEASFIVGHGLVVDGGLTL